MAIFVLGMKHSGLDWVKQVVPDDQQQDSWDFVPDAKIIVCIRNPLEVVRILSDEVDEDAALEQWVAYYEKLLMNTQDALFVHYDAVRYDPQAEQARILDYLGMEVEAESPGETDTLFIPEFLVRTLPANVRQYYNLFCSYAGYVYGRMRKDAAYQLAVTEPFITQLYAKVQQSAEVDQLQREKDALSARLVAYKSKLLGKTEA